MAGKDAGATAAASALTALLRLAHSGELAAALAYRGHGRSVASDDERARIRAIEDEEWHHRALLLEMLGASGAAPGRGRELRAWLIGRSLGLLCRISGWLVPMYGAGRLESRNIREYELAARLARDCGRVEWIERLLGFAEVEWEHEAYFRQRVQSHALGRRLPMWRQPPPKAAIRASYANDSKDANDANDANQPTATRVATAASGASRATGLALARVPSPREPLVPSGSSAE